MTQGNTPWLIVNSASGSYAEDTVAAISKALGTGSGTRVPTFDCQNDTLPGAADLNDANVRRIAIFAGDGTISKYLCRLESEGWDGSALPLPGGTKNLLCSAMFGSLSAKRIAQMYARGELFETRRKCMRSGPLTALIEMLLGPGARWADVREDVRTREIGQAMAKSIDIARQAATGALVRLVEPRVGSEDGYPGLHFALDDGCLAARGYRLDTPGEWAQQGWAMANSEFREGPYDDLGTMQSARCEAVGGDGEDSGIHLMVDGERESGGDTVEIELEDFGIAFLGLNE